MRIFDFDRALVRKPGRSVVHGLRSTDSGDPDFEAVAAEHEAYAEALRMARVDVTELPALEQHPDSIFVEDPALVFQQGAILLRPGAPSRREEAALLEPALGSAFDAVLRLPDGFADGGDVLVTPEAVFIGLSARTDRDGAEALAGLLGDWGYRSRIVEPPHGTLHFKTGASLVDEETILATRAVADSGLFSTFRLIVLPEGEEGAANVLRVNNMLLAGARYERTLDLLAERQSAEIVPLRTDAIAKIDAGLTCMSLRWKAAPLRQAKPG